MFARALSRNCLATSTTLVSPPLDLDLLGIQSATLDLDFYYNHMTGDDATIELWDGAAWLPIWTDPNADVNDHLTQDLTDLFGVAAFQVRFDYQNAVNSGWFSVDDVLVDAVVGTTCQTAGAPPPAPDGSSDTSPLTAVRLDAQGETIAVTWDATSCPAPSYNLLYGDLASVAGHAFSGSACGIGAGSFQWNAVPAGDLFFLVVGFDGVETESAWGAATDGERGGLTPSGQCSATLKNLVGACPAR
jgi:hypothetical protein